MLDYNIWHRHIFIKTVFFKEVDTKINFAKEQKEVEKRRERERTREKKGK
jgi:hypothetical protein